MLRIRRGVNRIRNCIVPIMECCWYLWNRKPKSKRSQPHGVLVSKRKNWTNTFFPIINFLFGKIKTAQRYWTSLSDNVNEGMWIWETTGALLSGYIHWYPGQPDNGGAFYNEHCVTMNYAAAAWGDTQCKDDWQAICEQHPL